MKFYSIHGKLVTVNVSKYRVDWQRKVSAPQFAAKSFLFPYWRNDIVLEELRIPGSLFRIDLVNLSKKVIIEISPRSLHVNYNKFMHRNRAGYLKKIKSDAEKLKWAEKSGFKFVEFYDEDLANLSPEYLKEKFDLDL